MSTELLSFDDADALANAAAHFIGERARYSVHTHGSFQLALSGGTTPVAMLTALVKLDVPWRDVTIYQVDERVAPEGDVSRNATALVDKFRGLHATLNLMDVDSTDLRDAAWQYASEIPDRFDLVHLGLGVDGHTASLTNDELLQLIPDQLVAHTKEFNGYERLTMTPSALARAHQLLYVVSGASKAEALKKLLAGSLDIAASHVAAERTLVMADMAAFSS